MVIPQDIDVSDVHHLDEICIEIVFLVMVDEKVPENVANSLQFNPVAFVVINLTQHGVCFERGLGVTRPDDLNDFSVVVLGLTMTVLKDQCTDNIQESDCVIVRLAKVSIQMLA